MPSLSSVWEVLSNFRKFPSLQLCSRVLVLRGVEIQPRNGQIANVETLKLFKLWSKCKWNLRCNKFVFKILFYILHFEQFLGQTFVSSFIRKKWWIIFPRESNYEGVNKKSVVKQVSWLNMWSSQSFTSYFYFLPLIVGALYAINALSSVLIEYVWEQSSSVASYSLINIHTYIRIYTNQQYF